MKKSFGLVLVLVICMLIGGGQIVMTQDDQPTLRELADLNDLHIGAAVYTSHLADPVHAETLAREFNTLTHEQEAKPCEIQSGRGQFNFTDADEIVNFAEANDMSIHGHTLVWHSCTPSWIENGDFSREEAIEYLRDYIYTVAGRYQGRIPVWDVVNEGIADDGTIRETPWHRLIGDDYIEMAFQFAHEADPDALLFYNDYGIEGIGTKSDRLYEMAQDFLDRGIPIHGVGLQGHFTVGGINRGAIASNIERFGELGLEVHFTEIDVRFNGEPTEAILEQQARDYRTLLEICLESEACTTFIIWGVSDRFTWLRGSNLGFFENPDVAPLIFDDDYQPKPAYFALADLLAREAGLEPILEDEEEMTDEPATVELPEPTMSDPDQVAPDSVAGQAYYAPFPVTINIDGETGDWENIPRVTVDSGPTMLEGDDTSLQFAVAADSDNLYFLADVTDSNIVYGNYEAAEWYREDSVELYLNTTGNLATEVYEPGIVQIGILAANLTNPEEPLFGGSNSMDSQINFTVVETENGYRVEAAIPLDTDVWSIQPEHLGTLGFQVHLNGSSDSDRDTKLIWSAADTMDQSWQNPSLFGQLIFWSTGSTEQ